MDADVTALMEFYEEHDKEVENDGVMSELRKHGQWEDEQIESDDDPRGRGGSFGCTQTLQQFDAKEFPIRILSLS